MKNLWVITMAIPYQIPGATAVGLTFDKGVVLGAEKRVSYGTHITSKSAKKLFTITNQVAAAAAGMIADMNILGTSAIVTDLNLLGTSANVTAMGLLGTSANVTAMATVSTNIAGVNSFVDDMEFPIGVTISETGSHKIILDETNNFTNIVYLKDNYSGAYHNLSESAFNVNLPIGEYFDRYTIVFQTPTLGVSTPAIENVNVFYDGLNNIVIANIKNIEFNNVEIYNVMGQQILMIKDNLNNQDRIEIPFNESDGVYLIVLNINNSKKSTKILKY